MRNRKLRISFIITAIAAIVLLTGCTKDNNEGDADGPLMRSVNVGEQTIQIGGYNVTVKLHGSIPAGDVLVWAGPDKSGNSVIIKTSNEAGRKLKCLLDDGGTVSPVVNGQYFTFTISDITKDITATVCYEYFELKAFVYPSYAGSISEYEVQHQSGDEVSLEVTPGELGDGGSFVCWKDKDGNIVSTQPAVDLTMESDVTLVAVFDVNFGTDVLSGVFTVAPDNGCGEPKRVRFSKGNLYWNGEAFQFEDKQACPVSDKWDESHVSLFYWSMKAELTYKMTYSEYSMAKNTDTFFTNTKDFALNGVSAWYNLSNEEWQYLLTRSGKTEYSVTIDGKKGNVLKPDDFNGSVKSTYTAAEWETAEREYGLVFMPYEGYRDGGAVNMTQFSCLYWTGTAVSTSNAPRGAYYFSLIGDFHMAARDRYYGVSVRLVSDYIE